MVRIAAADTVGDQFVGGHIGLSHQLSASLKTDVQLTTLLTDERTGPVSKTQGKSQNIGITHERSCRRRV